MEVLNDLIAEGVDADVFDIVIKERNVAVEAFARG
jgi:hypothetical protein